MEKKYSLWLLLLLWLLLSESLPWLRVWLQKRGNRLLEDVKAAVICAIEEAEENEEEEEGLAEEPRVIAFAVDEFRPSFGAFSAVAVVWPILWLDLAFFIILTSFVLREAALLVVGNERADVDADDGCCNFLSPTLFVAVAVVSKWGVFFGMLRIELHELDVNFGSWLTTLALPARTSLLFNGGGSKILSEALRRISAGRLGGELRPSVPLPLLVVEVGLVYEAYLIIITRRYYN